MCGGPGGLWKVAGSYLFTVEREGFAGGPFHSVNQSESLHYVQPLMAEGCGGGERVTDAEQKKKKIGSCLCVFVSISLLRATCFECKDTFVHPHFP